MTNIFFNSCRKKFVASITLWILILSRWKSLDELLLPPKVIPFWEWGNTFWKNYLYILQYRFDKATMLHRNVRKLMGVQCYWKTLSSNVNSEDVQVFLTVVLCFLLLFDFRVTALPKLNYSSNLSISHIHEKRHAILYAILSRNISYD